MVGIGVTEGWRRPNESVISVPVDVNAMSGGVRYVRVALDTSAMKSPVCCARMVFQAIDERDALPEVSELRRAGAH